MNHDGSFFIQLVGGTVFGPYFLDFLVVFVGDEKVLALERVRCDFLVEIVIVLLGEMLEKSGGRKDGGGVADGLERVFINTPDFGFPS